MSLPFDQIFVPNDFAVIGLLIVLEGVLSIDNALVLGLLAKRLPKHQQSRALTYGLIGAFVFRFIAIATAQFLLRIAYVKLLGGVYLLYVAGKYFFFEAKSEQAEHVTTDAAGEPVLVHDDTGKPLAPNELDDELQARLPVPDLAAEVPANPGTRRHAKFWPTVGVIELTDIAFAIDSILAAIALVGPPPEGHTGWHPKLWVVVTGGMLGVVLMRFAAVVFIRLLERFPRFEVSAYLLVAVIGGKLTADWWCNSPGVLTASWWFDRPANAHMLDFHSTTSVAFWMFWTLMLVCLSIGFIPKRASRT